MNTKPEPFWLSFLTGILAMIVAPACLFAVIYLGVANLDAKRNVEAIAHNPVEVAQQ